MLQEKLPDYRVVNFVVPGYSTVQSLIQFKTALKGGQKPEIAVVAYALFHDQRNTLPRWRRKVVASSNKLGEVALPYARLDAGGRLRLFEHDPLYKEWFGMRFQP